MLYLDTSVALAQLLAEDRVPPASLWREELISSRLLEYEVWTRLHARGLGQSHGDHARDILQRVAYLELVPAVVGRVMEPFPGVVRTLDALHLASIDFLRNQRLRLRLATYDTRMRDVARRMRIPLMEL